ncbi:MAG: chorismate synthase, partial [Bacteroidetes bacterium QH_1_64_81]
GVRFEETLGSPIAVRIDNGAYEKDKAGWPETMAIEGDPPEDMETVTMPRPGHADLAGKQKYEHDDMRPVIDRSSARETAMRVACCSIARRLLNEFGIEVGSHVVRIGDVGFDEPEEWVDRRNALIDEGGGASAIYEVADESATRMLDDEMTERCVEHIDQTKKERDSLGGAYEVVVTGVPPGLGSYVHWDRRLDGQLVQAICSIQAQKAAEVGDGFYNARRPGSQVHDPIEPREDGQRAYPRRTNHAGGTEGGTSTGMPLVVRGYMKPIPTLIKPLDSVDTATGEPQPTRYERSDITSVPAASTVAEATVAYTVANEFLRKYGGDSVPEIRRHVEADRTAHAETARDEDTTEE